VIGREARAQMIEQLGRLPDAVVACVGGGSNAIGLFADFMDDDVRLVGVEAAGKGLHGEEHGATLLRGTPGILHGAETYLLQDSDGQVTDTWSVSAGLDYPAVGPEHAHLKESGRAQYVGVSDQEALAAFRALAENEGILCAFESAHALAHALKVAENEPDSAILVGLSGRGAARACGRSPSRRLPRPHRIVACTQQSHTDRHTDLREYRRRSTRLHARCSCGRDR